MRWLAALGVMALTSTALAGKPVRRKEAGGEHIRLETKKGAVHVWIPSGYVSETAGIALYVHGYYTNVDKAWKEHRLAEQFAKSRRNALFIAPEAPDGLAQPVFWSELGDLLQEVRRQTGLRRPWGPVVAMVHSGGYRTAVKWLEDESLEQLILLDAMYGDEEAFGAWVEPPGTSRQLIVVGADTLRWTETFAYETAERGVPTAVTRFLGQDLDERQRKARVIYMRAGDGHMDLVQRVGLIPVLYQMTRLPAGEGAR
jgi:hypothetical protein